MSFLKSILSAIMSVLAPFLLVAAGAGVTSLGLTYDYKLLLWTGLVLIAAGIFWGFVIFMYYGGAD